MDGNVAPPQSPDTGSPLEALDLDPSVLYVTFHGVIRELASSAMRRQRSDHTFQTEDLVDETWLRISKAVPSSFHSKREFLAFVAHAMRSALLEHRQVLEHAVEHESDSGASSSTSSERSVFGVHVAERVLEQLVGRPDIGHGREDLTASEPVSSGRLAPR